MGTDIHLHVERYNDKYESWEPIPFAVEDCWGCDGTGVCSGKPCRQCTEMPSNYDEYGMQHWAGQPGKRREHWYHNRNYNVFAVLANVRNGYGFAGVMTGRGFNVIAEPRGLPEDLSYELEAHLANRVEHTPTWLNLREVEEFDWSQTTYLCGVVNAREYLNWKKTGQPNSWGGGISGPGIEHVSNEEMDKFIADGGEIPKASDWMTAKVYTRVEWEVTYEESCSDFLEAMKKLRAEYPKDNLRLVFYFDS